jgi:hypothetical protein
MRPSDVPSLETILTSREFFALEKATACQRAICRIAEGLALDELATDDDVRQMVGGREALDILTPGSFRPKEVDVLSGIRGGKSLFVAAHAFWSSQVVNLDSLRAGEVPRFPIVSINVKSAEATLGHLVGTLSSKPLLKPFLVGDPVDGSVYIRHSTGALIEVCVAAGARAGANLVSVWLCGLGIEELGRQAGEAQGFAVNFEAQLAAASGRVLDGGQILCVGSPWAPFGPAYERSSTCFGKPTPERVILKARGPQMNPEWWTPERCESLKRTNATSYVTDVCAEFCDPSTSALAQSDVRHAVRKDGPSVIPPTDGGFLAVGMDPASRGNDWTLVLVRSFQDRQDADQITRYEVMLARRWSGSTLSPLSPAEVLREIAQLLRPYFPNHRSRVFQDQASGDANRDLAARFGLEVVVRHVSAGNRRDDRLVNPNVVFRNDMYEGMIAAFQQRVISTPDDKYFVNDLLAIQRVTTRLGVAYDLPKSADGRHCDFAPALALALHELPGTADLARASAYQEKTARLLASIELNAGPWGIGAGDGLVAEGMPPEQRRRVLERISAGDPEPYESMWSRISRVQMQEREAAEAARAAEKGTP